MAREYVLEPSKDNLTEVQKYEKYQKSICLITDFLCNIQILHKCRVCKTKDDVQEYDLSPFVELEDEELRGLVLKYFDIDKEQLEKERQMLFELAIKSKEKMEFKKL